MAHGDIDELKGATKADIAALKKGRRIRRKKKVKTRKK